MENALAAIGRFISGHLKGGVIWLYIVAGGSIVIMYGYIQFLENRIETVKLERDNAREHSASKGAVGNSVMRQAARKETADKDKSDVQEEIVNSPDPITYSFEWLLNKREAEKSSSDE